MDRWAILFLISILSACDQIAVNEPKEGVSLSPSLELTGRVVDQADLLPMETEEKLTRMLDQLEKSAGPQFVIVTTETLNGRKIEDYSVDLARAWAIGDENRDDGVLLLVAPNERKVRIEVGYGLEASLSDPFCAKVIREEMIPAFSNGKMEEGIVNGAARLIEKMQRVPTITANDNSPEITMQNRMAL